MGTIARMDVRLGMDSSDFERGAAGAQRSFESMTKKLQSVGASMSLGVTAPLAGIAAMAVTSAADFEQSLNVMAQVSGATADQMATLQAQALELGAATSFSAGEAAQAQLELAKAGLGVNDIIAATPGVLDMAAAGGMGLAESAEIAANALNAFNLPASEMGGVANMLAAAANASSVDISDLAAAMKMSGAVFAANKQPMDDMIAALAMLGNAGLKGSDAGTSLKTMMLSLAAPTDAAYQSLTDMNVAVYDSAGNMRGFSDILNDLSVATATMNDEQRNVALSTIFGSDAIRAATILTRDYSTSWDAMSDALGNGTAAADVANARMKGVGGAVEYLKGSIDSFLIGAALPYMNAIGDIIRSGADMITAFGSMPQPIMDAAVAFGAVMAAAGPVMLALSGISTALGFLLSPIGLIVVAVATLAAAWQTNFGGIRDITMGVIGQLTTAFGQIMEVVSGFTEGYLDLGETVFGVAQILSGGQADYYAISGAITTVQTAVQNTLVPLQNLVEAIADAGVNSIEAGEAIGALPAFLQPAATAFQNVYLAVITAATTLSALLAPAIGRVQEAFAGVGPALAGLGPQLQGLVDAFTSLWTAVQPILQQLGIVMATVFGVVSVLAVNMFAQAINSIGPVVSTVITQVTASINMIATVLTEATALVSAIIQGDWSAAWSSAQSIFTTFVDYFRSSLVRFSTLTGTIFSNIYKAIMDTLNDLGVDVPGILNGIQATWERIWNAMKDALSPVTDAVAAVQAAIQSFSDWLGSLTLPNPFEAISGAASAAAGAIAGLTGQSGQPEGKAVGGAVSAGVPYIVGERGQELFVPNVNGTIIPNSQLNGWMADRSGSGGDVTLNNYGDLNNGIDLMVLRQMLREVVSER